MIIERRVENGEDDSKEFNKTFQENGFNYTTINFGDIKKATKKKQPAVPDPNSTVFDQHCPRCFSGHDPEAFNKCVETINQFVQSALRNKNSTLTKELHQKICTLSRKLGFPQEFSKKSLQSMNTFLRTKEFLTMVRINMHQLLNNVIYNQFNINAKNKDVPLPRLLKNIAKNYICNDNQLFKFYTDTTGNNHTLVRALLKRRCWQNRMENLKQQNGFNYVSFFWT